MTILQNFSVFFFLPLKIEEMHKANMAFYNTKVFMKKHTSKSTLQVGQI